MNRGLALHVLLNVAFHLAAAIAQATSYEVYSDTSVTDALSALDPPYTTLVNVDYHSEQQDGHPAPRQELREIHNGGIVTTDAIHCAKECSKRSACNMASYYGEVSDRPDPRNCWLKELLQLPCQFPADLERHSDNRLLLLARPSSECSGSPLYAPPLAPKPTESQKKGPPSPISRNGQSPPDSTDPAEKETIKTDEQKQTILGTREMDSSVPKAYEIENSANIASVPKWGAYILIPLALGAHILLV